MPVKHKIKAQLYENLLTRNNPNDYMARTISEESLNIKQICEVAVSRGGADMSALALEHAVVIFLKEMAYQLCDGYSVNTGYFTAGTQIRGLFNGPSESYNSDKHNILFNFQQGEKLKAQIPNIEVEVMGIAKSGSAILQVIDANSGSINDKLTPGRILKVIGKKLKIAGDSPEIGIFFVNSLTNERLALATNDLVVNKAKELIIIIPDLKSGSYHLEVVSQYSGSHLLKRPTVAQYDHLLTVE